MEVFLTTHATAHDTEYIMYKYRTIEQTSALPFFQLNANKIIKIRCGNRCRIHGVNTKDRHIKPNNVNF